MCGDFSTNYFDDTPPKIEIISEIDNKNDNYNNLDAIYTPTEKKCRNIEK